MPQKLGYYVGAECDCKEVTVIHVPGALRLTQIVSYIVNFTLKPSFLEQTVHVTP